MYQLGERVFAAGFQTTVFKLCSVFTASNGEICCVLEAVDRPNAKHIIAKLASLSKTVKKQKPLTLKIWVNKNKELVINPRVEEVNNMIGAVETSVQLTTEITID